MILVMFDYLNLIVGFLRLRFLLKIHIFNYSPGPNLMRIPLVLNSTSAIFGKNPKTHLVRPIIHLMRILPIIHLVQKFALSE